MRLRAAAIREYAAGSLWVVPAICSVIALGAGLLLSLIRIPAGSPLAPLAFQGTADDARNLLIAIASTVVTVIALVLGLTVVALQLSSTQFSPRLLRNFLRDRATQRVLTVDQAPNFALPKCCTYTAYVLRFIKVHYKVAGEKLLTPAVAYQGCAPYTQIARVQGLPRADVRLLVRMLQPAEDFTKKFVAVHVLMPVAMFPRLWHACPMGEASRSARHPHRATRPKN